MNPEMVSETLIMRLRERTIEDMILGTKDEETLNNHTDELFRDLISKVHKEEQSCENAMAIKEEQSQQIGSLLATIDVRKVELAKDLHKEKELLIRKKEALESVLSAENTSMDELIIMRNGRNLSESKTKHMQQLKENCNRLRNQINEYLS